MNENLARDTSDSSPGGLDKLLNKLSISTTPSQVNLRSRRGVPTQELELQVEQLSLKEAQEPSELEAWVKAATASARDSLHAESQRKRERIAELRRRRLNNFDELKEQAEDLEGISSADIGSPTTRLKPMSSIDRFFNGPELDLLLQSMDVDATLNQIENAVPSKQPAGRQHADESELDFTIDIPPTSFSPVVPLNNRRGKADARAPLVRRRSRTTINAIDADEPKLTNTHLPLRPRTTVNTAEVHRKGGEQTVLAKVEVARRRNLELQREISRLDKLVDALTELLPEKHATGQVTDGLPL
ncbi:hypothetical protein GGI25_003018 [Coemansia spiralis]|uniref:Uncharacterized protein n=2 Tax=Coemansia TaxID=4863 RepID=A0A9W8KYS6_9FUNG|nr:hypothetical protein BX070DRAFT_81808 [Coemansia spiralis]KAJ1992156.1 hypothetical protein EDC05_002985 [Coemansia umbellata]KAJ2622024.1 hypothetical protein GGI26_003600 [Coemansia sp. RSA 1358]KAJ2677628.1 hypothetical protein GGI25_003018 [Coemansia spiralis]